MAPSRHAHDKVRKALRSLGLSFPEAVTSSPWPEHLDLVVRGKTFAFLNIDGQPLRTSLKLPMSQLQALELPFASPAGYGLAKSGWVAIQIPDGDDVPFELLSGFLGESYRAQAPKSLLKKLDAMKQAAPLAKGAKKAATKQALPRKESSVQSSSGPEAAAHRKIGSRDRGRAKKAASAAKGRKK